ncbi:MULTISPECIES: Nif3-like dinuclear metal center hexameric protein [Rossellomorea]|uniref:Nif3-like dinuclear metal center hexameric protein n=1 Tax=Rossellomorea TaxID=2837508 RepID=UPI001CCFC8AA|nr:MULTISPECIES: Nif3-like dinuclear metal center hexameric protein [Rossellomorea]MCA0147576.1 Nif3-like dinuclear metal center hexameric protein [Rossellomorea vietnamensis]UTE76367.1 Nif3-like dinuclear metal center hexameric protein [Rossellomorea sp. KS-H15a]WGG44258.1 Nif3-like dinuclear metal center hexameric protein [Rossellomorea sp. DA94]
MKTVNGHEIIQLFEEFSPKYLAESGDPIGLQIGKLNEKVENVMITLDVLENVVDEAIKNNVKLIIAHHPPLFRPLKSLQTDSYQGRMIEKLIKHDISVYAAHTNLDVAVGGVNDLLASKLQLQEPSVLVPTYQEELRKLAVYVPKEHAGELREALGKAGAGHIGNYSHCSFSSEGQGRFLPGEGTHPHIGKQGALEEVSEEKVETVYPVSLEKKVLKAMFTHHPYEEIAYDIYSLENGSKALGLGRIGYLAEEMSLKDFALFVKKTLGMDGIRLIGDGDANVKKVAVLGGDGNKFIGKAKRQGADVFVSGDIYYHTAHDAMMMGLNIVDAGHHIEKVMKEGVAAHLAKRCSEKGFIVNIFASKAETNPFTYM